MPVSRPTVIAMHGPPGSGKSTLARALSRHLVWPLLDKDDLKDLLDGQTPQAGALSYELLLRLVDRQLRQGVSVVCDSPLLARTYAGLVTIVAATGGRLGVVTCHCADERVWRQRITERQEQPLAAHHTTTWEDVERFLAQPGVDYPIAHPHLRLDTTRSLAELVSEILVWLDAWEGDRDSQWKTF
jgi:predicted kinase